MCIQVCDRKSLLQFCGSKSPAQVLAEGRDAKLAMTVVPVKVVGDETIDSLADSVPDPRLQHLPPMRIVQTGPILEHPADAVALTRDRLSRSVLFQKIQGVRDGLWAEDLFVPLVTIKSKEATRPFRTVGITYQELYIHVPDHLHATLMQLGIESRKPFATFAMRSEERRVGKECRSRWSPDH